VNWLWLVALAGCDYGLGLNRLGPADAGLPFDSLDDGLVAWYSFEDSSFTDLTGHGHTATCIAGQCPAIEHGHIGMAARFDGVDDRLVVTGTDDLSTTAGFTIAIWMNVDAPGTSGSLASKLYGTTFENSWQLHVDTGQVFFYTATAPLHTPALVNAGHWQHVAARSMGMDNSIFVDGIEKAVGLSTTSFDHGNVVIGADEDSGTPVTHITGLLDELRIYNRPLSSAELAALAAQ
jgi:hypothetical protein